jgi:RNA polymerase sigma-70 factor (ECF subfamily)
MEHDRFAGLVAPHTGAMAWTAASLVGLADAEDAAQEALLRAWNGWETLREESAVRTWLLRITVNVCHNWHDGRFGAQRRLTVPLSSVLEAAPEVAARLTTPGPQTGDHEALDLRAAVARLPDDLRQVVMLRYFAEMDSTEISSVLQMPASTVRRRLQRAIERLRSALGDDEDEHAHASGEACERGTVHD